jgi:hypothetical protein
VKAEPDRVLSQRELNRALLARQLLLERVRQPIPKVLERLCGIQNQYAPNAYIRLWSCVEGFERDSLTRAYEAGKVVQGTLMRGTIHTVSPADYRLFAAAIREPIRDWARRVTRDSGAGRPELVKRVRTALRGRTVGRTELMALGEGANRAAWLPIDVDAELLRAPPSGTWERRRADMYALASDVIGESEAPDPDAALEHLIARYLGGFGPASRKDIADFTGVPPATLKPALERMTLRRFADESGKELLDVPNAPLPPADTPAPVRFLPNWDAVLLVHARRTGILDEAYRKVIFHTKMPPSYPTVLVDGRVVGTWKYSNDRVATDLFEPIPKAARRELDAEAERLAAFHR